MKLTFGQIVCFYIWLNLFILFIIQLLQQAGEVGFEL